MTQLSIKISRLTAVLLLTLGHNVSATVFSLPITNDYSLVGIPDKPIYVKANKNETLLEIARQHDLGQNQIVKANKKVDRWMPSKPTETTTLDKEGNQFLRLGEGKNIHIPNSYLLPNVERTGIVLNLPEYRLYYYRHGQVITHPISIGRVDWNTPLGKTSILAKVRNPTWTPPASIRKEHAAQGDILPAVFPAGPDNPLGLYAMRLARAGYLIHSTNKPLGVGMRVSHGCIRMYPEDIERIFPSVAVGTQVEIINEPIKVGWANDGLYIEVHPDLEDAQHSYEQSLNLALTLIEKAKNNQFINISGSVLKKALIERDGIPVAIYKGTTLLNPSPPANIQVQDLAIKPTAASTNNSKKLSTMPPPPRLNDLPSNALPQGSQPAAVPKKEYNNVSSTITAIPQPTRSNNLPPPPRLNNKLQSGNTEVITTPASLPKLHVLPKNTLPSPPRLKDPGYSILKSAMPPD